MRVRSPLRADVILDAAARLFGTRRFHEVRMDDIGAEAQVSKGTLYRYFKDKDELYLKLLDRASAQFTCRVREAVGRAAGPRDRLVALSRTVIDYFDEQPHILELIQRAELLRGLGADFPWRGARDELFHTTLDLIQSGVRQGDFAVPDPEVALLLLLGGLRSIIRFGERPRPPDIAERAVDALIKGGAKSRPPVPRTPHK